jgi:hypothetical protein
VDKKTATSIKMKKIFQKQFTVFMILLYCNFISGKIE